MKKYVHRQIEGQILKCAKEFPAIVLTGARQTGKTTLLQNLFPKYNYVSLDDPMLREIAIDDPKLFIENCGEKAIIDEIQYVPQIFPHIKIAIDKKRSINGRFLLTGSQIFPLMSGLSESLAGRVAVFQLLGLSFPEFLRSIDLSRNEAFRYILNGFYPDPLIHKVDRIQYYSSYLQTYLERDIRQVTSVQDLKGFQEFLELLAARIGSLFNLNEISRECGISFSTAKRWLSLLETTGIVYLLRPYHKNISKRVVKSPKLYFTDTGLAAFILRYLNTDMLAQGPLAGNFFENMICSEILKFKFNNNSLFELYFYRDSHNNEIDFVIGYGNKNLLLEVKATNTIRSDHTKTLERYGNVFPNSEGYLLSFAKEEIRLKETVTAKPWYKIYEKLGVNL